MFLQHVFNDKESDLAGSHDRDLKMADYKYYEDFSAGDRYKTESYMVAEADIVSFATRFDPQLIHIGGADAIASGWHTTAVARRLFITSSDCRLPPGSLELGVSGLKWLKPVYPGDSLYLTIEVRALRQSASRPSYGIITYGLEACNQDDEPVMVMETSMMLPIRDD